jgi:hypothetical protein
MKYSRIRVEERPGRPKKRLRMVRERKKSNLNFSVGDRRITKNIVPKALR